MPKSEAHIKEARAERTRPYELFSCCALFFHELIKEKVCISERETKMTFVLAPPLPISA